MDKKKILNRVKIALKYILGSFNQVKYGEKILYLDGDVIEVGVGIFDMSEEGELIPLNDGEYEVVFNDVVYIILVESGVIKEFKIKEDVVEEVKDEEIDEAKVEMNNDELSKGDFDIEKIMDEKVKMIKEYIDEKIKEIESRVEGLKEKFKSIPAKKSVEDKPVVYDGKNEIENIRKYLKR